jgi:hypothetical protein
MRAVTGISFGFMATVRFGDWIVKTGESSYEVYKHDEFHKKYRLVPKEKRGGINNSFSWFNKHKF